jgi:hypothetical protein
VAFWVSAGVFLAAAIICGALIRRHPPQSAGPDVELSSQPSPAIAGH